ncbi:MAG: hypothetical protein U1F52_16255 [Burkholderiales bacterium]
MSREGDAGAPVWLVPERVQVVFFPDAAGRTGYIEAHPGAALVAEGLPLRANLTVLENIALVPQVRRGLSFDAAADLAFARLSDAGYANSAGKRDPDLTHEERFVTKLVRAVLQSPPIILIDRPGLQLPDTPPATFLARTLSSLASALVECQVLEYTWNAPLYAPRASAISA